MKNKLIGMFSGAWVYLVITTLSFGWIYNIVWIIDNWSHLSTLAKVGEIFIIFAYPLGGILGLIHFF